MTFSAHGLTAHLSRYIQKFVISPGNLEQNILWNHELQINNEMEPIPFVLKLFNYLCGTLSWPMAVHCLVQKVSLVHIFLHNGRCTKYFVIKKLGADSKLWRCYIIWEEKNKELEKLKQLKKVMWDFCISIRFYDVLKWLHPRWVTFNYKFHKHPTFFFRFKTIVIRVTAITIHLNDSNF